MNNLGLINPGSTLTGSQRKLPHWEGIILLITYQIVLLNPINHFVMIQILDIT